MKRVLTIVALICAVAFQANAQESPEEALKNAEAKAKLADENPTNGKMQYQAAMAFLNDNFGDKIDVDRALPYAERALKIAQEQTVPQDTLMGLTCHALGTIYLGKKDFAKGLSYYEKAVNAFEQELGKLDPVTNGFKLIFGYLLSGPEPTRAFGIITDAFKNNSMAQIDKRIQNMQEATIAAEMGLEMLIHEQTEQFRYALPQITYDGKRQLIVQTSSWNMGRPLVGWLQSNYLEDEEDEATPKDDVILCDDNGQFTVMPHVDGNEFQLSFNFRYYIASPNQLTVNPDDARIWYLKPEIYKKLLAKYREFKASKK